MCNKFISNSDCSFTIQNEEFTKGYVYVYFFQLITSNNKKYNQVFIKTNKFQEAKCTIRKDGHYSILVAQVPNSIYMDGDFIDPEGNKLSSQDIIDNFQKTRYDYFSTCHLQKCFISACEEIFNARGSIECNTINISKEQIYRRDLIWSAINTIKYLVEMKQYNEAQRILDKIQGCNGLCKEEGVTKNGGCGCG